MTKISNKQKEAISEIYLMCTVCTDIRYKLSFLSQLYGAIRSALLKAEVVKVKVIKAKDSKDGKHKEFLVPFSEKSDPYDSAKLLNETKTKLYAAYSAFADRNNWIGAEQIIIEIIERLSALGYLHEFIDIEPERWNASYYMISPNGNRDNGEE